MAWEATTRLYDVDEHSVIFTRLNKTNKYDQATLQFKARKGKLIDLRQLHESLWATRLSGGTRSGLVSLQVTLAGSITEKDGNYFVQVGGSKFTLKQHPGDDYAKAFRDVVKQAGGAKVEITGMIERYAGRWPTVLKKTPSKDRSLRVMKVSVVK